MTTEGACSKNGSIEIKPDCGNALNRGGWGDWGGMLSLLADNVVNDLILGPREVGKHASGTYCS